MPRIFLGDPAKDSFEVSFIGAIQMRRPLKGSECNGLVYIRGCQEHFSPSAGGAGLVRDFQPLSP